MRTTPTAAIQFLLDIPPLHIFVERAARCTALRLNLILEWQLKGSFLGHREIWSQLKGDSDFLMPCDAIKSMLFLTKNFKIIDSTRDDWTGINAIFPLADTISCYTDGSLKDGRAGSGVFCSDLDISLSFPLGQYATVFMVEI